MWAQNGFWNGGLVLLLGETSRNRWYAATKLLKYFSLRIEQRENDCYKRMQESTIKQGVNLQKF